MKVKLQGISTSSLKKAVVITALFALQFLGASVTRIQAQQTATQTGVPIVQIDSVEVLTLPQVHHGEFVDGGLIHIHTRRARGGEPEYWIRGIAVLGNETGDPGPYRYTEHMTPNVDKTGPDYSAAGFYGSEDAYVRAAFLKERHYATDAATRERNLRIADGDYPQLNVIAPSAAVGGDLFGGSHHVFLVHSEFEDFFFYKPYGREIPVVSRFTMGGGGGRFEPSANVGVEYRLTYTVKQIDYRQNSFDLDFDWETKTLTADVEAGQQTPSSTRRLGVGIEHVEALTGYALTQNDYLLARLYADWDVRISPVVRQRVGAVVTGGESDVSLSAVLSQQWRLGGSYRLDVAAAYLERRPEKDGRIWYWNERGYNFLEDAGVRTTFEAPLGTARQWTVDAALAPAIRRRLSWTLAGYYRKASDLSLEEQIFEFDPDEQAFSAPVHLVTGRGGEVAGVRAVAETRHIPRLHLRTAYRYQKAIAGDRAFKNLWNALPEHHFQQTVSYTPVPNFRLWGMLSYSSASEWADYRDAAAQSGGAYRSKVDGFVTLDAAVEKWFSHRRFRGSLLVKDLLNQSPNYHPIGASLGLSVFVQLELVLGSSGP